VFAVFKSLNIISAIDRINDFIEPIKTFQVCQSDFKTQSAVERQLGIIGKAVDKFKIISWGILLY